MFSNEGIEKKENAVLKISINRVYLLFYFNLPFIKYAGIGVSIVLTSAGFNVLIGILRFVLCCPEKVAHHTK